MKPITGKSQGFTRDKWYFPNLIMLNDKGTCSDDIGQVVVIVYLDFSKACDTVSRSLLLEKLCYGTDK